VAVAQSLLQALAESRDDEAWEHAQGLAKVVLDDPRNVLAKAVLEGGPFAMRKAEELAEVVLNEFVDASAQSETSADGGTDP
jgi:hypothetical protein